MLLNTEADRTFSHLHHNTVSIEISLNPIIALLSQPKLL